MSPRSVEETYRLFLLMLPAVLFLGTMVELALEEHFQDLLQIVPFVLAGLGVIAVFSAWRWPSRRMVFSLRVIMGVIALGSFFGIYEHVAHNAAFAMEIRPGTKLWDVAWEAVSGASPLLAPGILALAALLALASTYQHPLLDSDTPS